MKTKKRQPMLSRLVILTVVCIAALASASVSQAQQAVPIGTWVTVEKTDDGRYVGVLLSADEREVLLDSTAIGSVMIPRTLVRSILPAAGQASQQRALAAQTLPFSSRYFITTNGFPIGDDGAYILFTTFGPDFQFAPTENLSVGILTTYIGSPILGSIKATTRVSDNVNAAAGALIGWNGWIPEFIFFALPYGSLTFGSRASNVTLSTGYGYVSYDGDGGGRAMFSVAGQTHAWSKVSLMFDSIILSAGSSTGMLVFGMPGVRVATGRNSAFQVAFPFVYAENELRMVPVPTVGYFVRM
ncbi:MAG: hypothetical protein FGM32_01320 [Candidatus Kapabacteria bacterium]|nr:hypothetical protein [Candidatus Kapabacteria bacterium]